jgi:transcriptional regulator with XRE-family HTH domain
MPGRKRTDLAIEAARRNADQLNRLGGDVRAGRHAKRLTQAQLGDKVGLGRQSISRAERGRGEGLTLDAWQRIGVAVDRPLTIGLQRPTDGETADAAHLAIQELVLRLGRAAGAAGTFELATKPAEPWRSADVGLTYAAPRRLVLVECWNTIGDVGAASRATDRKRAEAEGLAAVRWGERAASVGTVWVVRATARNRALVSRYPEVFRARFPGSSAGWVRALVAGTPPPDQPGLVWCDLATTRLFAWRRPPSRNGSGSEPRSR